MKILSTALTIFFLASCATAKPFELPRRLKIAPQVGQAMLEIQREYEVETARCLTGFVENGTIYVESMEPTWILRQTSYAVEFQLCESSNTVGWFHNHPQDKSPEGPITYCSIASEGDVNTLTYARNFWVAIITCQDDKLVYKFKLDGKEQLVHWYGNEN